MFLCMIAFPKYYLLSITPHQLILTLLYQTILDIVDTILFNDVSKYIFGTLLVNG